MKFSVIVPTCDRIDLLSACLERLAPGSQTLPAAEYQVIVTDDGSQAGAKTLIDERFPWARWVQGPRSGPAANRNSGAAFADGNWLVFTDDDCLPDGCWLEAYDRGIAANESTRVFEGRVYANGPRRSLAATAPLNDSGGYLWSCNFAIWADLFREMNGFDERFRSAAMEDVELAKRLGDRSQVGTFLPEAAVCHPWRLSGGWKEILKHQEATALYLSLHPNERRRITSRIFVRLALRGIVREIVPALFSRQFAGVGEACIQQMGSLLMALRLAVGSHVSAKREKALSQVVEVDDTHKNPTLLTSSQLNTPIGDRADIASEQTGRV